MFTNPVSFVVDLTLVDNYHTTKLAGLIKFDLEVLTHLEVGKQSPDPQLMAGSMSFLGMVSFGVFRVDILTESAFFCRLSRIGHIFIIPSSKSITIM